MAKPVDVSVETFFRENPEYNFSRMLERAPRVEESVLPKGSPSSLRASRRVLSDSERTDWVNREVRKAYSAWKARRSGALGYRSEQSVPEQLTGAERFLREFYGAAEADADTGDTGDTDTDTGADTGTAADTGDSAEPIPDEDIDDSMYEYEDLVRRDYAKSRLDSGFLEAQDESDIPPMEARLHTWEYREAQAEGLLNTFPMTAAALESGESPRETAQLSSLLDAAQDGDVYERDLGGGRHEIEIDNADPDKRGRFIRDENDDTLTNLRGR